MKRVLPIILILAMVFSLAACGGGDKPDYTGKYICIKSVGLLDNEYDGVGEYLELKSGGKAEMCLSSDGSDASEVKWKLDGDKLSIENFLFTFEGTLKDDVIVLEVLLTTYTFAKEGSAALANAGTSSSSGGSSDDSSSVENSGIDAAMLGTYDCTGWDYEGSVMSPAGEWLTLETESRGTLYMAGNEYPFDWTLDGETMTIKEDVGPTFTATFIDGVITLDTGMLYFFEKGGVAATDGNGDVDEGFSPPTVDYPDDGVFVSPTTEIEFRSTWYGTIWAEDVDYFGEIWGVFDRLDGYPYFEIYESPELSESGYDPILSMYISGDTTKVVPDIGEDDAWFFDRFLTDADTAEFTFSLDNGALYFNAMYEDEEGDNFRVYLFLREDGLLWDEANDPLPPGYDQYKSNVQSYG